MGIHFVNQYILRVLRSYDFFRWNKKIRPLSKVLMYGKQSYIRKASDFIKIYCENLNPDQNGK